MSRLYDRIIADPKEYVASEDWQSNIQSVNAVVVADKVALYRAPYAADLTFNAWSNFPNAAPPFEHFFIEIRRPVKYPKWYPLSWGVEFQASRVKSEPSAPAVKVATQRTIAPTKSAEWFYKLFLFTEYRKGRILLSFSRDCFIGQQGSLEPTDSRWYIGPNSTDHVDEFNAVMKARFGDPKWEDIFGWKDFDYIVAYWHLLLCVPFMAISLINCKNVELVDKVPSPHLSERHERDFGIPLTPYKMIRFAHKI